VQERINRWAKEQRDKGRNVKVGTGRVRIEGIWRAWSDIEIEEERRSRERVDQSFM
jgi:hypothetical protein